jgi:hypothetical protein
MLTPKCPARDFRESAPKNSTRNRLYRFNGKRTGEKAAEFAVNSAVPSKAEINSISTTYGGWGARIRTWDHGTKARCLTAWPRPNSRREDALLARTRGDEPACPQYGERMPSYQHRLRGAISGPAPALRSRIGQSLLGRSRLAQERLAEPGPVAATGARMRQVIRRGFQPRVPPKRSLRGEKRPSIYVTFTRAGV